MKRILLFSVFLVSCEWYFPKENSILPNTPEVRECVKTCLTEYYQCKDLNNPIDYCHKQYESCRDKCGSVKAK